MSRYDWNDWFQRFDLAPDMLITLPNWYPLILANRQGWPDEVALSGPFIRDLLAAETMPPDWTATLQHYLEQGELAAARTLLQHPPGADEAQLLAWQQQLDQRTYRLESDFDHLKSQLLTYQRSLVSLGVTTGREANPDKLIAEAEALFELNRLGPAIQRLDQHKNELQAQLETHRQRIVADLDRLRPVAEAEQDELRVVLLRLIDEAQTFLDNHHLARAERLARQARILQESRDLTQFKEQSSEPEEPLLREEFPPVRAKEILAWLDGKTTASPQHRAAFFEKWCLREWLPGQAPSKEDATYPSYEALAHLADLESGPPPFSRKTADRWTAFLQALFNLLGKQGLEPAQVEPILTRDQTRPKKTAGFWLGHFDETFAIPHTFIDPVRLPGGLAVILWHGATDPICPKPANLQSELEKRGLTRQPVLFLASETIYPEDRDALQRALPAAALLDERDLLQLIFCSEQPEIRAMHFARAISRQLPIEDVSPFSAQSDVTGSMFVGRRDVLKKFSAPNGPSILYGGRKLGKSSIFRQLQRDFENQAGRRGQNIAVYINAINVVDGTGIKHTLLPEIVRTLNHALVVRGFKGEAEALEVYISPDNGLTSDQFAAHIRNLLRKLPQHRFLLLIDEADSLLQYLNVGTDALLDPSKRLGWEFRALIQESGGRFDVRFAGFQDISRVTQITTGPFYNFRPGQAQYPLSVLPPNEARELVRRPLQLLDVVFSDDSLIELILDYTGQHPALIQEFCRLLYKQIRSNGSGSSPLKVTPAEVETVWKDPEFRRDVVRAIHLNVETRNTKPEKILRLLLYLWINNMMAPTDYEIPIVADSAHLYQLLARTFGREPARQQVTKSDLDKYLADLATLGVLKKHGSGYAFHYRYFARLLYYDTFHGQLDDTVIKELWDSIITHEDRSPRMPICIDNRLSISPFRMLDQELLESERDHVILALGAPGTGKTRFFQWLQGSQETLEVRIVDASALQFETLKAQLAAILEIEVETATWQMLADQTLACCTKLEKPVLVVFDNVDTIAAHPDWPLLYWPNSDDAVAGDDGLLFTLAGLTRASSGKLRFVLTGAFPLARFWVEVQEVLADVAQRVVTHRLTRSELDAWFMGTRLLATTDVKRRLWQLTQGDWRLLNSLLHWLDPNLEELREADLHAFEQILIAHGPETLPELQRVLQQYDPQACETFRALAVAARELGVVELEAKTWCEFLPSHRPPGEWLTELRAAVLLQELDQSAPEGEVVVVPAQDKWFRMLVDRHV